MKFITYISLLLIGLVACNPDTARQSQQEVASDPHGVASNHEHDEHDHEEEEESIVNLSKEEFEQIDLRFSKLTKRPMSMGVGCTGYIEVPPQSLATISTPIGGFVSSIVPYPGSYVKKGEVLAILSHPDYIELQQNYLQVKSELAFLAKEYERQKSLVDQKAGTQKILQKTESEYMSRQAQLAGLSGQLKLLGIDSGSLSIENMSTNIKIRAPFSGYVSNISGNYGKYIAPQEEICKVINKNHMHLELQVFEKDMYRIEEEQPIRFSVAEENSQQVYEGHVRIVAQHVNPETRTLTVHGHMDDESSTHLKPGTFVNATIFTSSDSSFVLPSSAFIEAGNKNMVFVREAAQSFRVVELKKGQSRDGYGKIENPEVLPLGAEIVTRGAEFLYREWKEAGMEAGHSH